MKKNMKNNNKIKKKILSTMSLSTISLCVIVSCGEGNSHNSPSSDTLIFGHSYGQCHDNDNCVETFKLSDGKLYEDKTDDIAHKSFDFELLDNAKYNEVKGLHNQIPDALLALPEGNIGCVDCADGGGIYIQYIHNGVSKTWNIDKTLGAGVPASLHDFVNTVNSSITKINKQATVEDNNFVKGVKEITFGSFAGECQNDDGCATTFKITETELFEDKNKDYRHKNFNFQKLDDVKFKKVRSLLNVIPKDLLEQKPIIGNPDSYDQGGLYVQLAHEGNVKSWNIDNDLDNVPLNLQRFTNTLKSSIKSIVKPEYVYDGATIDYLVFGKFNAGCVGDTCIETYKLTDNKLFKDTLEDKNSNSFNFVEMNSIKFDLVKDLINSVHDSKLSKNNETIGCPDCADQGGFYIEYSLNGAVKKHKIDTNLSAVPSELHDFVNLIKNKIQILKESNEMMCTAQYDPVCVKQEVNGNIIFKTYSNECSIRNQLQGELLSITNGACL